METRHKQRSTQKCYRMDIMFYHKLIKSDKRSQSLVQTDISDQRLKSV